MAGAEFLNLGGLGWAGPHFGISNLRGVRSVLSALDGGCPTPRSWPEGSGSKLLPRRNAVQREVLGCSDQESK